ncbi:g6146 [Coccomyxa elongata]
MRTSGAYIAALLLLAVGVAAGRQLQEDPVYVIDPWGPLKYSPVSVAPYTRVMFRWRGPHGVYRIPNGRCPVAFNPSPSNGIVKMHAISDGGAFSTQPLAPGTYWFTSPVPGHCHAGTIIKIIAEP